DVYRSHAVVYGVAMAVWLCAALLFPGVWSAFWPMMTWTIAFTVHLLIFKGTHVDPDWVEARIERIVDEAKDFSHIEDIRGDYTQRRRKPPASPYKDG
ncbi:MAG: hypothetical protein VW405_07780, partial [Rhodospirillaceae bacterium]